MRLNLKKIVDIRQDNNFIELIKGSSIAFILRILGIIAGYFFTFLITRSYGAEAMGIFSLSFTLLQILSVIGRLGMDTALLRFVAEYSSLGRWDIIKDIYKKAIKLTIPFSIFISILIFLLSPYISNFVFKKSYFEPYLKIISFGIVPFVLLFIHTESLRGLRKILLSLLFSQVLLYSFASIFIIIFLLTSTKNFLIPLISIEASIILTCILSIIFWLNFSKKENVHNNNLISYMYILKTALPMMFTNSLAFFMGWVDTFMLGIFDSVKSIGIYNVVIKLIAGLDIFIFAINAILSPQIARLWSKSKIYELNNLIFKSNILLLSLIIFPFLIYILFSKQLLSIFGDEFTIGFTALYVLLAGKLIRTILGPAIAVLNMTGFQHVILIIELFSIILNVILNYVLIVIYNLSFLGAAISTTISFIFLFLLSSLFSYFKLGINTTIFRSLR